MEAIYVVYNYGLTRVQGFFSTLCAAKNYITENGNENGNENDYFNI